MVHPRQLLTILGFLDVNTKIIIVMILKVNMVLYMYIEGFDNPM